ncbi:MAG: hypothetical protein ACOC4M_15230 [Promethearchaeia archaeon]
MKAENIERIVLFIDKYIIIISLTLSIFILSLIGLHMSGVFIFDPLSIITCVISISLMEVLLFYSLYLDILESKKHKEESSK